MSTTPATPSAEMLTSAREAAAGHRWQEALDLFKAVDAPGLLTPNDLDLMGDAA